MLVLIWSLLKLCSEVYVAWDLDEATVFLGEKAGKIVFHCYLLEDFILYEKWVEVTWDWMLYVCMV